jgi:hypothetical protein
MTVSSMLTRPSAFLPLAMSAVALATVLAHIVMFGVVREADEGAAAHIFQLLMSAEAPIVAFFAIKWLPRAPRQALQVLGLQVCAALSALAPVFVLGL